MFRLCGIVELLIKPGGSGRSDMSRPDEDSAERSTENNSKRNQYHACITGARILAVHAKELLKAILIDLPSVQKMQHLRHQD